MAQTDLLADRTAGGQRIRLVLKPSLDFNRRERTAPPRTDRPDKSVLTFTVHSKSMDVCFQLELDEIGERQ